MDVFLDFETRSFCDLKKHGAWNYSIDPTTEILCLSYAIDNGPPQLWFKDFPHLNLKCNPKKLDPLFKAIKKGARIYAHNAFFERSIWKNICEDKLGWPHIKLTQWRCTMAIASFHAIPISLERIAEVLDLPYKKDMEGNAAMKRCTKPNKKGEWHEDRSDLIKTFKYCPIDVEVSRAVKNRLTDLPDYELKIWRMDQIMNTRGVLFDRKLAEKAVDLKNYLTSRANLDLYKLTDGAVSKTTTYNDFWDWTEENGYSMRKKSLAKDEVPKYLDNDFIPKIIRDAIKIKASVSLSSINKYAKMLNLMGPDDRVRNNFLYGGAGTLRWTSRGVQLQNIPRSFGKWMNDICEAIINDEMEYIEFMHDTTPINALKKTIRGAIIAPEGKELSIIDYSSVEARGLFWLVNDVEAIKTLKESCIYCDLATSIFGYEVIKGVHDMERQFGKQGILGLGYQMGYVKFYITIKGYGITIGEKLCRSLVGDEFNHYKNMIAADAPRLIQQGINPKERLFDLIGCRYIMNIYRNKYPLVRKFWYDCERAAIDAVSNPYEKVQVGKIYYYYDEEYGFLQSYLPSGRPINYFDPRLRRVFNLFFNGETAKGRPVRMRITTDKYTGDEYEAVLGLFNQRKIKLINKVPEIRESSKLSYMTMKNGKFIRVDTYGGKQTENNVQAICRDLLAESMIRTEKKGYPVCMTVHDELVSENEIGKLPFKKLKPIMNTLPAWAEGFPIDSEGFTATRYRKG